MKVGKVGSPRNSVDINIKVFAIFYDSVETEFTLLDIKEELNFLTESSGKILYKVRDIPKKREVTEA